MCAPCSIGTGAAIAVKAGDYHICILRATDTPAATKSSDVLCWGDGAGGQLVRLCVGVKLNYVHAHAE
jgi:hypothetical protein